MGVYVDKIGVEFMHSPVKSERLYVHCTFGRADGQVVESSSRDGGF
jgi:hypothetical protein